MVDTIVKIPTAGVVPLRTYPRLTAQAIPLRLQVQIMVVTGLPKVQIEPRQPEGSGTTILSPVPLTNRATSQSSTEVWMPPVVLRPQTVSLQPPQVLELHKDILGETIPCLVCPPFRHTAGRFLNSQTEVGTLPLVRPRIEVRTVTAPPTLLTPQ